LYSFGCLAGIVEANSDALSECKEKYPDARTFAGIRDAINEVQYKKVINKMVKCIGPAAAPFLAAAKTL